MNQQELDTSLIAVVKAGITTLIGELIIKGANVNCTDTDGKAPIWYAVMNKNLPQINVLIANKADLNVKCDGESLFIYAINNELIDIVELLLDAGCDYTVTDKKGRNISHLATNYEINTPLLNLVLTKCPRIDINCLDPNDGCSVLYNVCYFRQPVEVVQRLLTMGANSNIQTKNTRTTPLMMACEKNSIDVVKVFLKHPNIDINIKNKSNMTALEYAEKYGCNVIVQLLKNHNGPKKIFDKDGTEKVMPIVKKPLYNIKVFCDKVPVPLIITIEGNTSINCLVWNPTAENWDNKVICRPEKFTVEFVPDKMSCHECPELGLIQFDQLTMPDGTVRSYADLYQ